MGAYASDRRAMKLDAAGQHAGTEALNHIASWSLSASQILANGLSGGVVFEKADTANGGTASGTWSFVSPSRMLFQSRRLGADVLVTI